MKFVTKKLFSDWLKSKPKNDIVCEHHCPIKTYFLDQGDSNYYIGSKKWSYEESENSTLLPAWAIKFIDKVDTIKRWDKYSAEELLDILKGKG